MAEQFIPIENIKTIDSAKGEIFLHEEIVPPPGTFFIRGITGWSEGKDMTINYDQISISLHKDKQTEPLRPFGFIIKLDNDSIIHAYDRDVTTESSLQEGKFIAERAKKQTREYTSSELKDLINNTSTGKHNEIIVHGNKVEVIGAYILEGAKGIPGIRKFRKYCNENKLHLHEIPKVNKK